MNRSALHCNGRVRFGLRRTDTLCWRLAAAGFSWRERRPGAATAAAADSGRSGAPALQWSLTAACASVTTALTHCVSIGAGLGRSRLSTACTVSLASTHGRSCRCAESSAGPGGAPQHHLHEPSRTHYLTRAASCRSHRCRLRRCCPATIWRKSGSSSRNLPYAGSQFPLRLRACCPQPIPSARCWQTKYAGVLKLQAGHMVRSGRLDRYVAADTLLTLVGSVVDGGAERAFSAAKATDPDGARRYAQAQFQ